MSRQKQIFISGRTWSYVGREYVLWSGKFHKNIFIHSFHPECSESFLAAGRTLLGTGKGFSQASWHSGAVSLGLGKSPTTKGGELCNS